MKWAMADTRTSINPSVIVFSSEAATQSNTTPMLPFGAQRKTLLEDPAASSENRKGNDSGLSGDDPGAKDSGGGGDCDKGHRHDQASTSDEAVDLGELADRVADALARSNDRSNDEPRVRINVEGLRETLSTAEEALSDPQTDDGPDVSGVEAHEDLEGLDTEALKTAAISGIPSEMEAGKVCGKGGLQKTCSLGEECCNSSCGTCAPRGQSCLQIECGKLTSGNTSSKVDYTCWGEPYLGQRLCRWLQLAHVNLC